MRHHCQEHIAQVFRDLHRSGIEWLLLRNSYDELPDHLPIGKDVDVLVRFEGREELRAHLRTRGYRKVAHPLRNDVRLYGVHEFEMYRSRWGVILDVNFEIAVRSLDNGQWIPLDQVVQASAWRNRSFAGLGEQMVPTLGHEDMFACTAARCVFDRREFPEWHCRQLKELLPVCDEDELSKRLYLIFFKYTDRLLADVRTDRFAGIVDGYLAFSDY